MKNQLIPYRKDLKIKARELRKNSTTSEVLLWCELKGKQLLGYEFHRQVPMLDYIVDFYCHELKLAIEIDGDSHEHAMTARHDNQRQQKIEAYGVTFLRFDDKEVKHDIEEVVNTIYDYVNQRVERR